jgi:hypothetical protein
MKKNEYGTIGQVEVGDESPCSCCKYKQSDLDDDPCCCCNITLKEKEYYIKDEDLNIDLSPGSWIKIDPEDRTTHPTEYGKYLVCRKDGKIHLETWNGSGWAYNGKVIVYYAKINNPVLNK